ncbi:hypothetical protein D3C80_1798650 [compost metagenome]
MMHPLPALQRASGQSALTAMKMRVLPDPAISVIAVSAFLAALIQNVLINQPENLHPNPLRNSVGKVVMRMMAMIAVLPVRLWVAVVLQMSGWHRAQSQLVMAKRAKPRRVPRQKICSSSLPHRKKHAVA